MKLIKDFENYLRYRNLSENTIVRYLQLIHKFIGSVGEKENYTKQDVINFIANAKACGAYNRYSYYVLKSFFGSKDWKWEFNPKESPKTSDPYMPMLSWEQAMKMLEYARNTPRDYAIIRIFIVGGIRRNEMVNIKLIDYKAPILHIKTLKNNYPRDIELDPDTIRAIDNYIKVRTSQSELLFEGISVTMVSMIFRYYAGRVGLKKGGCHALRRSYETWLYTAGMTIKEINQEMGYKTDMASHYVQIDNKEIKAKVKKAHPFFN